jgi:hypothetical protein
MIQRYYRAKNSRALRDCTPALPSAEKIGGQVVTDALAPAAPQSGPWQRKPTRRLAVAHARPVRERAAVWRARSCHGRLLGIWGFGLSAEAWIAAWSMGNPIGAVSCRSRRAVSPRAILHAYDGDAS